MYKGDNLRMSNLYMDKIYRYIYIDYNQLVCVYIGLPVPLEVTDAAEGDQAWAK